MGGELHFAEINLPQNNERLIYFSKPNLDKTGSLTLLI
jgi:hypothetical protein